MSNGFNQMAKIQLLCRRCLDAAAIKSEIFPVHLQKVGALLASNMSVPYWLFCALVVCSNHTTTFGTVDVDQDMEPLAEEAVKRYLGDKCKEPQGPANVKLQCGLTKTEMVKVICKAECPEGFSFADGTTRTAAACDLETGIWDPSLEFPDCIPSQNAGPVPCPGLEEVPYSTIDCGTEGTNYTCTAKCDKGYQFTNLQESDSKICDSATENWVPDDKFPFCIQMCANLMQPVHGTVKCSSTNDVNICVGECDKTYKFLDGSTKIERSCDFSTGVWSSEATIPDCVSYCETPAQPVDGSVICEINNSSTSYVCRASCIAGFRFTSGERTLENSCLLETGVWDSELPFPDCVDPCINPRNPENGGVGCKVENDIKICTAVCETGLFFPNGASYDHATCDLIRGGWISYFAYDLCLEPCQGTRHLNTPRYGNFSCETTGNTITCIASCDEGFEFSDESETSLSCNAETGAWSPHFTFPDCTVECIIPLEPENSVLSCERSLEDQSKYLCDAECNRGYQFPNGKQKMQHYCDLTNLEWSPRPHFLDCIPLCVDPSKPLNGEVYCFANPQDDSSYNCEATCHSGFEFQDGSKKIVHSCSLETGEWSPKMEFPDCAESCEPSCQNNGVCAGNNTCICEKEFRGDRCQYERDVCRPSKTFHASASWNCSDVRDGYSCTIKCSDGTKFSYTPSNFYYCSFDGVWTPDQAPTCEPLDTVEPLPPTNENDTIAKPPDYGICATWNRRHYSTFDGNIYNFKGLCTYLLFKDCEDGTFAIHVDHKKPALIIYIGTASYTMTVNLNVTTIEYNGTTYNTPAWIDGLLFKSVAHYTRVIASSLGFNLKWDGRSTVLIKAFPMMFKKTCGLCGNFDTIKENDWEKADGTIAFDVEEFANSWKVENFRDKCEDAIDKRDPCSAGDSDLATKASEACQIIMDPRFQSCHKIVAVEKYFEACTMDFCERSAFDENYICNSLSQYFRECTRLGQRLKGGWRNDTLCSLNCKNGLMYNDCGSACPKTCDNHAFGCEGDHCVDGCHCPDGMVLMDSKCIQSEDCPCEKNGKFYQKGEKLQHECKTCICMGGKFQCTKDTCMSTCSSIGSHYTTFDGYRYDHITTCPVYLVYHDNFTIIQEKTECLGNGNSAKSAYCVKGITINIDGSSLVLKSDPAPIFNGKQVPDHPFTENGITVYRATSLFIKVELPNSLSILWDGKNDLFIDVPLSLWGQTKGLCGTFNHNQMDDFVTPNGDVEADVPAFVQRWQYFDTCFNREQKHGSTDCDQEAQNVKDSETFCSFLKQAAFSKCHNEVNPEVHYQSCMNDICSCQGEVFDCICPMLKQYSFLCAKKGVVLDWMKEIPGCKLECSGGKVYQECSNPCKSSCRTIAEAKHCIQSCVPGCACAEGLTLDDEGNCLPIDHCPCVVNGREYSAQTSTLQDGQICECSSAKLECRNATEDDFINPAFNRTFNCSGDEEFTNCVDDCPETCQNTMLKHRCKTETCRAGCKCKEGYILDLGKCIKMNECGCRHGGKKYEDGYVMKYDCNLCTCIDGAWKCTMKTCPGRCTVWGASHFKTFDGYIYDFNGNCEFRLSMGELSDGTKFSVSIENNPCGTSGVTCSKKFILDMSTNKTGSKRVELSETVPLPKNQYDPPFVYDNGLYVFVFTNIGLSLQWDKGTRMYVILEPTWRNRVSGLCGNYDDDWENDFQTPSGGMPEVQPTLFANSWKLRESCPQPNMLPDACSSHPFRRTWARRKCSVLHSPLFQPCHSEVNVKPYHDKCVFDTCTCDEGGDCECLCTSIAAYAQECNINGVHVRWRSQELCPIQCESCSKYESCRSLCPKETCENEIFFQNVESYCASDICIEGCNPEPCPPGSIYNNSRDYICIPRDKCRIPCREVDGIIYYEGERVKGSGIDICQTCHCILGEISCKGTPCTHTESCPKGGWTPWIDISVASPEDKVYELLNGLTVPQSILNGYCSLKNIIDIECMADGQLTNCILYGPLCSAGQRKPSCKNYVARVYCNCKTSTVAPTTETLSSTTTLPRTTPTPLCASTDKFDTCAYRCNQTCHSFRQELIKNRNVCVDPDSDECIEDCRPKTGCEFPYFWRDYVTCVKTEECTCGITDHNSTILAPNDVIKKDCETCQCTDNRLQCLTDPDCPVVTESTIYTTLSYFLSSITTPIPEPITISTIETPACWTEWINNSSSSIGGDFEDINSARRKYKFCSNPVKIECRTVGDEIQAQDSGQVVTCDLQMGLQCFDSNNAPDRCFDYEIRFYCPCETTTTMPTSTVTITARPPAPCINGWTDWYNSHVPDESGEYETVQSVREYGGYFCDSTMIGSIECRITGTENEIQDNVICDLQHGFRCQNLNLKEGETCQDYEVRFFCDCPTSVASTTEISSMTPTTSVSTTTEKPTITTGIPTLVPCAQWSNWINEHHPHNATTHLSHGKKIFDKIRIGDKERKTLLQLQQSDQFCLNGVLSVIECQTAKTGMDYSESEDVNLSCSLAKGFECRGKDQTTGMCQDYKIRYFCSCEEETITSSVVIQTTTVFPSIQPCYGYYFIANEPSLLPDSSFRASSSLNATTDPHNARLNHVQTPKRAGGWVPSTSDETPYLEFDLGFNQPVYGVVTKGRNGAEEWVTSYYVLYSRDGQTFSYVQDEEKKDLIFHGNYNSDARNFHVFRRPFEARYVRIQPLTWEKQIGLRADLLGCAEGTDYTIVIRITRLICVDRMGLQNGMVSDDQIKFSTIKDHEAGASSIRLNTKHIDGHGGGWVAAVLDTNQYVQIDFGETQELTGIITQGRDHVDQWVTAFEVHYSQDSISWHSVSTYDGNILTFTGNFDRSTRVINYFPAPIRARYLKVVPKVWKNKIAMRLDILGCYVSAGPTYIPTSTEIVTTMGSTAGPTSTEIVTTMGSTAGPTSTEIVTTMGSTAGPTLTEIVTTMGSTAGPTSTEIVTTMGSTAGPTLTEIVTTMGSTAGPTSTEIVTTMGSTAGPTSTKKVTTMGSTAGPTSTYIPTSTEVVSTTETTVKCIEYGPWLSLHDSTHVQGDYEPISEIINATGLCPNPIEIQCRDTMTHLSSAGRNVTCDLNRGLICNNSNQALGLCPNYEVRIGCWTCETPEPETEEPPLVLVCPEIPLSQVTQCPESCSNDYACDGSQCVPYANCPCYKEKYFYSGEIQYTADCLICDCLIGGRSRCKPVVCDRASCGMGEMSVMNKTCQCLCEKCPSGKVLCPSTNVCIDEAYWCDGVMDCIDDEIDCPTVSSPETTTVTIETTMIPMANGTCILNEFSETDSCTLNSNVIQTFDGQWYVYETCRHISMKEEAHESFAVTVHSTCIDAVVNPCERYVVINVGDAVIQFGPAPTDMHINNTEIQVQHMYLISKQHEDSFVLRKSGNQIIFESYKYHFQVAWDSFHGITITVPKCLMYQLVGLCGYYNGISLDDMRMPNGNVALRAKDFGDSWSIGNVDSCVAADCSLEASAEAIQVCEKFKEEPFRSCSTRFDINARFEACLSYMCNCLQSNFTLGKLGSCRCQVYESFADKCEMAKGEVISGWRIEYDCAAKCEGEMEWMDCGPGCELTCDNYHQRDSICGKSCVPGCYCPSGLVRQKDKCIKPKLCQDCVCDGQGDPNYVSFDGKFFSFQGNCTYVLTQHISGDSTKDFQILGTNYECPKYPHATCVKEIKLLWNDQVVQKVKNKPVHINYVPMRDDVINVKENGIEVFAWRDRQTTKIVVEAINLVLIYHDNLPSYQITLPSYFYYNATEGLCGICNFNRSDDMYHRGGFITDDVNDFAYSWLVNNTRENCTLPPFEPNPGPFDCNFTIPTCNMIVDPEFHIKSCENDAGYNVNASTCASKYMYAQQCCERGVSLADWIIENECSECRAGMHLECISGCQKTCDNYKSDDKSSCDSNPHYECVCPRDKVLKEGDCVDPILCETCDDEGHVVNDVWATDNCTKCECDTELHVKCTTTLCTEKHTCPSDYMMVTKPRESGACCETYDCLPVLPDCPDPVPIPCDSGKSLVIIEVNKCPEYACECRPDYCFPAYKPWFTHVGEEYVLEEIDCCQKYKSRCVPPSECPPAPDCPTVGFSLITYEGKCCTEYKCVPRNDACIYQHEYNVINGTAVVIPVEDQHPVEYKPGVKWTDGLCQNCLCTAANGLFSYICRIKICLDVTVNYDYTEYEWETEHVPGQCCPKYIRVKCKAGKKSYSVGEYWESHTGEKCKSYQCFQKQDGEVFILERTTVCSIICPEHEVYVAPTLESPDCCGSCILTTCEENGVIYETGDNWQSKINPCMNVQCLATNHGAIIQYESRICPELPMDCSSGQLVYDADGCCRHCQVEVEFCEVTSVPLLDTIAYFNLTDESQGFCSNEGSIADLTKCAGQCEGVSLYAPNIGDFENSCRCCLPVKTVQKEVELQCSNGETIKKIYQQPTRCHCLTCH